MTKLGDLLAEEWEYGTRPPQANNSVLWRRTGEHGTISIATFTGPERDLRAAVAVLGHRALALVLKHEWSNVQEETGVIACPECSGYKPGTELGPTGHTPGCTWGAICEEARRLG